MRYLRDIPTLDALPVLLRIAQVNNSARLSGALPSIEYLRRRRARVVLLTHISGTGTETARSMYDMMRQRIPGLSFCPTSIGAEARSAVRELAPGEVVMLENLRRNRGEEANDPAFAKELALLGDLFVEDAFDTCHRTHASIVTLPKLLPSYAGLVVEREIEELGRALRPKRPGLAIIGGAKFSTKEPVLKQLLSSYDQVFVGGALANDFLKARGYPVGTSLVSEAREESIRALLKDPRLVLPSDAVVAPMDATREAARVCELDDVRTDEAIRDAGPKTLERLANLAAEAKTILWNGPLGNFENGFSEATEALARVIAESKAYSIVGGGDTIAAIERVEAADAFSFISTGGGAMLEYLASGTLPGLEALG